MELFKACRQWSERPPDERMASLEEMRNVCFDYYEHAREAAVPVGALRAEAIDNDVALIGSTETPALFTHYAFGQIAARVGAPANYLRALPAPLAAQLVTHGLRQRDQTDIFQTLFQENSGLLVRALTTERYSRYWNWKVADRLLDLSQQGWRVPPARPARFDQPGTRRATEDDVLRNNEGGMGLSINVGDMIAPAGLYASDHDMFAFMVNEDRRINDGTENGMSRGFFIWNSEVGDKSLGATLFYYRHVCGNHIVWDASNVHTVRVRHVGASIERRAWREINVEVRRFADSSVSDDEARVESAKQHQLGAKQEDVLDFIFGKRILPRRTARDAYALAEEHSDTDGSPRSAWGFAQGVTRLAAQNVYADQRTELDRAAGRVLQMAF